MKNKIKNVIIGAGITGLSCAYHLKKKNKKFSENNNCVVVESESNIGGLARSKKIDGFTFDYSAHLLHCNSKYFYDWIQKNLKDKVSLHKRNAWVYSHGVFTKYPFQANLYGLPKYVVKECLEGLLQVDAKSPCKQGSLDEWCLDKFGEGISKHFMIPYNEKFWTLSPKYITTEWVDNFIPQPRIKDVLNGTFEYCRKEFGYNSKFFYPSKSGIEIFVNKLGLGSENIILGENIIGINMKEKWIETKKGRRFYYKNLVSTIPLVQLKDIILGIDTRLKREFLKLKHISVLNINLGINREPLSLKDWIYFPENNFIFYRVGFPMNFAPRSTPKGHSSIYVDISYSDWRPINKEKAKEKVRDDLIKVGILDERDSAVVIDNNDIKYAYILYDKNYSSSRKKILAYLRKNSIHPAGRFGAWQYLSMEGCFLEGKQVADVLYEL